MARKKAQPYECEKHGPYGPARFCCACTREPLKARIAELEEFVRDVADEPLYGGTPDCSDRARALVGKRRGWEHAA